MRDLTARGPMIQTGWTGTPRRVGSCQTRDRPSRTPSRTSPGSGACAPCPGSPRGCAWNPTSAILPFEEVVSALGRRSEHDAGLQSISPGGDRGHRDPYFVKDGHHRRAQIGEGLGSRACRHPAAGERRPRGLRRGEQHRSGPSADRLPHPHRLQRHQPSSVWALASWVDDVAGGALAADHLLARGHRRIGVGDAPTPLGFSSGERRRKGMRRRLRAAGIRAIPGLELRGAHGRAEARAMAEQLLTMPEPPDGRLRRLRYPGAGVLEAARRLGRRVPEDVAVDRVQRRRTGRGARLTTIRQRCAPPGCAGSNCFSTSRRAQTPGRLRWRI